MKQTQNSQRPLSNGLDMYTDDFNSFKKPPAKFEQPQHPISILKNGNNTDHDFEDSLLQKLEIKNKSTPNQPTRVKQEHQQVNDPTIRNLLGEIDELINRIGNENQNQTPFTPHNNTHEDYMVQTGQFGNVGNTGTLNSFNNHIGNTNYGVQQQDDFRQNHHAFLQSSSNKQQISKSSKKQVKIVVNKNSSSSSSSEQKSKKKRKHKKRNHHKRKSSRKQKSSSSSSSDSYKSNQYQNKSQLSYRSDNSKSPYKQLPQQSQQIYNQEQDNVSKLSYRQSNRQYNQEIENKYSHESRLQQKMETLTIQQKPSEVFCMVCEEFIHEDKVNEHCKFCSVTQNKVTTEQQNKKELSSDLNKRIYFFINLQLVSDFSLTESQGTLHAINEKLIKINYILSRKIKMFPHPTLIKCAQIVEGCCNQIILVNDSLDQLSKYLADLNIIHLQVNNLEQEDQNFQQQLHSLQIITSKILQFSMRKFEVIQQFLLTNTQLRLSVYNSQAQLFKPAEQFQYKPQEIQQQQQQLKPQEFLQQQQQLRISEIQQFKPQNQQSQYKKPLEPFLQFQQQQNSNNQQSSQLYQQFKPLPLEQSHISQQQQEKKTVLLSQIRPPIVQQNIQQNYRTHESNLSQEAKIIPPKGVQKKKLFEISNNHPTIKMHLMSDQIVTANKAKRVDETKENEQKHKHMESKDGIIFGNQFDPSQPQQQIILSATKNFQKDNEYEYSYSKKNTSFLNEKQTQQIPSEPSQVKKKESLISGISGFLSKISIIPSSNPIIPKNEEQKKNFFDLAVRKKNQLHCEHPAQQILIAELYDRCCRDRIQEKDWDDWINTMYQLQE